LCKAAPRRTRSFAGPPQSSRVKRRRIRAKLRQKRSPGKRAGLSTRGPPGGRRHGTPFSRGAIVEAVALLPPGEAVPGASVEGQVERLRIDMDENKMMAAGVTAADVCDAVARIRGMRYWPRGTEETLSPATQASPQMIDTLAATLIRSSSGQVTLGEVARIRIVQVPSEVLRHWP
jgi:hypothetical protein